MPHLPFTEKAPVNLSEFNQKRVIAESPFLYDERRRMPAIVAGSDTLRFSPDFVCESYFS
jgi:hypothetical protein